MNKQTNSSKTIGIVLLLEIYNIQTESPVIDLCLVLFLVCLYICVCECLLENNMRMYTSINIHRSKVHCRSAVRFGQVLPGYLTTAHHLYASLM